jgi:exonuclease V gamma subunit
MSLVHFWQHNLVSPLAASVKTSCAMLATPKDKSAQAVARKVYDGGYKVIGEVQDHYALCRLWPDFEQLLRSSFVSDSDQLYRKLIEHWQSHRNTNAPTSADTEDEA